ncbi:MAG TPA: permease [Bacteroidales bacterium]|nr:permease [Bacteroidales bacterium]
METKKEFKILFWIAAVFVFAYFMPLENERFSGAIYAMFDLAKWYAREHVVLCLLPAFFIAGVISVFVSQGAVMKYFGAKAKKWVAYTVASVSGTILAVCSCTILPLFSSIHKRGAGLGPAIAFLYSGPAINILAIILTARILGFEMGVARIVGAVVFAIVIGSAMSLIYRKEEKAKRNEQLNFPDMPEKRPMWQTAFHFFTLVLILVFANWGKPGEGVTSGAWYWIWANKWYITAVFGILLIYSLIAILKLKWQYVALAAIITAISAFISLSPLIPMVVGIAALSVITLLDKKEPENKEWTLSTWDFAKQIMPLLAIGVLIAGFLLGSTHDDTAMAGLIPNEWVANLVGGNSVFSNFFASIVGAFMYFATLTEVPILQGLMAAGMGKGPALALLLAGPSLSLPNMLVIRGVMGTQKTIVYVLLVVVMATISGLIYGGLF